MKAYPSDVVRAAIRCYFSLNSFRKAALNCSIPKSTIHRWVTLLGVKRKHKRRTRRCNTSSTMNQIVELVRRELEADPFCTVTALCDVITRKHCVLCSRSNVYRAMKLCGVTYKVANIRTVPNTCALVEKRKAFGISIQTVDYENEVVSIDETSFESTMYCKRGYAQRGKRLAKIVTVKRRERCTLILAVWANGEVFRAFVTTQMQPQHIRRQSMALLDNVAFHKSASTIKTLVEAGCNVLFTPPYSPEANPVENAFC